MYEVGELVKWYELYGDIHIAKDSGMGIVMSVTDICYGECKQTLYRVYCAKKETTLILEEHCLEKINEETLL
mgnify:CR=1 FL=1